MESPTQGLRPHSYTERREWERLPISIPFFVSGTQSTGAKFLEFATALNVSAGGALLASKQYFEPNTHITLEVPTAMYHKAHLPHPVSLLHATVLRCRQEGTHYLLGLQFEKPLVAAPSESDNDSFAPNL